MKNFIFLLLIDDTNFCKIFAYNTSLLYIRSDILPFFPSTNFFVLVNYMKEMGKCVHFLHKYKSFIPLFAGSKTPTSQSGGSSTYLTNCPLNIMPFNFLFKTIGHFLITNYMLNARKRCYSVISFYAYLCVIT